MSYSREYSYLAKAVLIGDGATGKTSLAERYCHGKFVSSAYFMTVGANFYSKIIQIGDDISKLLIWDIAGQPHFKAVRSQFYMGTMICLAVFDLTRYSTLINLEHWFNEMFNNIDENIIPTVLIGNKIDLAEEMLIDSREITRFIESLYDLYPEYNKIGIPYFQTSAKTGQNVEKAFLSVTEIFLKIVKSQK